MIEERMGFTIAVKRNYACGERYERICLRLLRQVQEENTSREIHESRVHKMNEIAWKILIHTWRITVTMVVFYLWMMA